MVFFAMPSSSSTRPKTHHGNDQLWPGDRVDLGTDIAGLNLEIRALGNEIADLTQEDPVDFQIHRRAVCAVPTMNLGLQPVALSQKVRGSFTPGRGQFEAKPYQYVGLSFQATLRCVGIYIIHRDLQSLCFCN